MNPVVFFVVFFNVKFFSSDQKPFPLQLRNVHFQHSSSFANIKTSAESNETKHKVFSRRKDYTPVPSSRNITTPKSNQRDNQVNNPFKQTGISKNETDVFLDEVYNYFHFPPSLSIVNKEPVMNTGSQIHSQAVT